MGKRGWLDTLIQEEYLPAIAALNDSPSGREQALVLLGGYVGGLGRSTEPQR